MHSALVFLLLFQLSRCNLKVPGHYRGRAVNAIIEVGVARRICLDWKSFADTKIKGENSMKFLARVAHNSCPTIKWKRPKCASFSDSHKSCKSKFKLVPCSPSRREHKQGRNLQSQNKLSLKDSRNESFTTKNHESRQGQAQNANAGGRVVKSGEVPYIAMIILNEARICSGAIIELRYILIPANCLLSRNVDISQLTVATGVVRLNRIVQKYQVKDVLYHPGINNSTSEIALIQLTAPVNIKNNTQPVLLPEADLDPVGSVFISGWGRPDSLTSSKTLKMETVMILGNSECSQNWQIGSNLSNYDLCTIADTTNHCNADEGAPMTQKDGSSSCSTLVGLMKHIPDCGITSRSQLITSIKVSKYTSWIQDNIVPVFRKQITKKAAKLVNAERQEFPFFVRITRNNATFCSGSVFHEFYVITAASCIYNETVASNTIGLVMGDWKVEEANAHKQFRLPVQFIIHNDYDPVTHANDIALIRVSAHWWIGNDFVNLVEPHYRPSALLQYIGWGSINGNITIQQKMPMQMLNFTTCVQKYGCAVSHLEGSVECATPSPKSFQSTCRGDIGSPLTDKWLANGFYYLYGIASFKVNCDDNAYPMVFTWVPFYKKWIDEQIKSRFSKLEVIQELPFHVFVNTRDYHACGGTILNERFILTAASCLANELPGEAWKMTVYSGKKSILSDSDSDKELAVRNAIPHEQYDQFTHAHDIALLELETPILFDKASQPIIVSEFSVKHFGVFTATILGYGMEKRKDAGSLQSLDLRLINNKACALDLISRKLSQEVAQGTTICTASQLDGNCIGDPGSSLFTQEFGNRFCHAIVGVVSQQRDCTTPPIKDEWESDQNLTSYPTLYTDVSKYRSWIQMHMERIAAEDSDPETARPRRSTISLGGKGKMGMGRVAGGEAADPQEFNYQVQVIVRNNIVCGGAILNQMYIITSAICAVKTKSAPTKIRTSKNAFGQFQERDVVFKNKHQHFDIITRENDIALFQLAVPLVFSNAVRNIHVSRSFDEFLPQNVTSVGWGYGFVEDKYKAIVLQQADMKTLPLHLCWNRYGCALNNMLRPTKVMCAEMVNETFGGICEGDQGSPLVHRLDPRFHTLVGIASFRIGCSNSDYPGVYTRISFYYDWIQTNKLVGEHIANPNDFPFQVAVLYEGKHVCAGTIVSRQVVMLPPLCFKLLNAQSVTKWSILAGNDGHNNPGSQPAPQNRSVSEYNQISFSDKIELNDIILIRLSQALVYNVRVQPAILPLEPYHTSRDIVASSWVAHDSYSLSQKINVHTIQNSECSLAWNQTNYIHSPNFCTSLDGGKICSFDFVYGGPLAERLDNGCHVLIGLQASNCYQGIPSKPNIYNNVSLNSKLLYKTIETLETRGENTIPAVANQFKFLVRIIKGKSGVNGETICAGAIVESRVVVTVASCFKNVDADDIFVIAGDVLVNAEDSTEQIRKVDSIAFHFDYNPENRAYDVALLVLESPWDQNKGTAAVILISGPDRDKADMLVAGWGSSVSPNTAVYAQVLYKSLQDCANEYKCSPFSFNMSHVRCGTVRGGFGPGFLGAPLVFDGGIGTIGMVLYGLHSSPLGCDGASGCSRLFTDVGRLKDWILDTDVGGELSAPSQFPFQALIDIDNNIKQCSGAVLSESFVLTAASCILTSGAVEPKKAVVTAGIVNANDNTSNKKQTAQVIRYFIHPAFQANGFNNDICILELSSKFKQTDRLKFARLPPENFEDPHEGTVSSWHAVDLPRPQLRHINIPLLNFKDCTSGYLSLPVKVFISEKVMCTSTSENSFCFGHDVAFLTVISPQNIHCKLLVGLSNNVLDCNSRASRNPSLYTKTSSYLEFIEDTLAVNNEQPLSGC